MSISRTAYWSMAGTAKLPPKVRRAPGTWGPSTSTIKLRGIPEFFLIGSTPPAPSSIWKIEIYNKKIKICVDMAQSISNNHASSSLNYYIIIITLNVSTIYFNTRTHTLTIGRALQSFIQCPLWWHLWQTYVSGTGPIWFAPRIFR